MIHGQYRSGAMQIPFRILLYFHNMVVKASLKMGSLNHIHLIAYGLCY